jgi:hypothetical protein
MCLLAIQYRLVPESPILVAANREEFFNRRSTQPTIQSGKPRILCPGDQRSGGTWIGANQNGVFLGYCQRHTVQPLGGNVSRALLCREALRSSTARKALDRVLDDLSKNTYEAFNMVIADRDNAWVVHHDASDEVVEMEPGLHVIGSRNMNDPRDERGQMARRLLTLQTLDSAVKFLAVASRVFARNITTPGRPSMVIRGADYGTVSSTLMALGGKPRDAIFQFADGPADEHRYEDYSPALRDILSRGLRESRTPTAKMVTV